MGDEFPKTFTSDKEFFDALGVTFEPGDNHDKIVEKVLSKTSNSYKIKAKPYEKNGDYFLTMLLDFFGKVYSQIPNNKDITDEKIKKLVVDFYKQQNLITIKSPFWSEEMYQEHVNELRTLFRLPMTGGFSLTNFGSNSNKSQQERATFEPERFAKKLGLYVGASFGIVLLLGFMALSPSLIMNDFIYKPPMMRIILGLYASLCFIFIIPYYAFIGLANNSAAPHKYTLFPISIRESYEWSISNYFFGRNGYIPTLWTPDEGVLKQMTWLKQKPHPKDIDPIPITLESILG
jgi:hypothetical protein